MLLSKVMNNPYYITNLRRKGSDAGYKTVVYELIKRSPKRAVKLNITPDKKDRLDGLDGLNRGDRVARNKEKRFVLRDEFPFLNRDDCPDEFKLLVSDMITSHDRYIASHEELYYVANKSDEECFKVAEKVVEHYLNNRFIWDELSHYKRTGKILGLHQLFSERRRATEIEEMEAFELMKLYRNLPRSINSYKKRIKEEKESDQLIAWKNRLGELSHELKIARRLLQIHDGGKRKSKATKAKRKS
jgi:hypothetical protein